MRVAVEAVRIFVCGAAVIEPLYVEQDLYRHDRIFLDPS